MTKITMINISKQTFMDELYPALQEGFRYPTPFFECHRTWRCKCSVWAAAVPGLLPKPGLSLPAILATGSF